MKILDRYILVSYLQTFFTVFVILMFIFVLQAIWLYIGELAGKDLDVAIILKFLLFTTPKLVPMVLPLTILLTSIMVFGNFAENYEFAAMKSSGISLQRAMRSLTLFILLVSVTGFVFANNVIPAAEFKILNLRKNIAKMKPAMAISAGVFNDVGNINIKVDKKTGDNDQYLHNVIIHMGTERGGDYTVIKSKEGELVSSEKSNVLSLILTDGNYYREVEPSDYSKRDHKPFAKSHFSEYTMNIDLSSLNQVDMEDESYTSQSMLRIGELTKSIDSFSTALNERKEAFAASMYGRTGVETLDRNFNPVDSVTPKEIKNSILDEYDTQQSLRMIDDAIRTTNAAVSHLSIKKQEFKQSVRRLNKYEIALHEKYVLAVACIVLFFVGAPLGAIIRKGGMGLPMVIAIIIFLTYHFIGIFAKNSAEDGSVSPFIATWLSTLIMLPLGIYFTYRATTDQGLFSFDSITRPISKFLKKMALIKHKDK
ncbi:LptF/LptG family permease [Zunongwangia sp. HGR-M22]|uniref:LptF/LptG family permease n=1 Tax=Zunongwangia sp. HGR-M22 TaxID=3015168 RepID=UPI0022DD2876|nr:LptF/LptG family permease [Zunongwangia sp. HGR-M22]WBL26824.1 LptF/LptG family permease [Zunongwangia sp. HGR-M22]